MKLKPRIGIDHIYFGMKLNQVIEILSQPSRQLFDPDEPDQEIYEWYKYFLTLTFYMDEEGRLGYIRTRNPELEYLNKKVIDQITETVKSTAFDGLIQTWDVTHHSFGYTVHFDDSNWISLEEEYGRVMHFEMGVSFKEGDESIDESHYDWPNVNLKLI